MSEKQQLLAYLDDLMVSSKHSKAISDLDEKSLSAIKSLVEDILERERAGLDSLFSSMTHTMKFIPNLLLQTLTIRYIEPPIAARITEKLTLKQAVAVANGLKAEYVAETSCYLTGVKAAELLTGMQTRKASKALAATIECHPERALVVMENLHSTVLKKLADRRQLSLLNIDDQEDFEERLERLLRRF